MVRNAIGIVQIAFRGCRLRKASGLASYPYLCPSKANIWRSRRERGSAQKDIKGSVRMSSWENVVLL